MKLETIESDQILVWNYEKFENVEPDNIGVDQYFTLNAKSPLM